MTFVGRKRTEVSLTSIDNKLQGLEYSEENSGRVVNNLFRTELLGLFWTLSIVLCVEDKNTTTFR
jgi:hypothetical protein